MWPVSWPSRLRLIPVVCVFLLLMLVYSERRRQVEKVCNKLGTTVTFGSVKRASLDRLRWVNSRHFIMCFNAKVGTSSWSRYLLKIVRPNWKGDTHVAAMKNLVPLENRRSSNTLALMEEFGKVMIVRHPFARVLSAYLNKIASKKMLRLTQNILKHYRSPASSSESAIPTLEEFVMYLVNTIPAEDDIRKKAGAHTNIHWRPYYVNCAPCNIHYDIILKMDTIDEDTRYVSHRYDLEVEEILRKNKASNNSSEINAFDLFKTLPRNLTLELYKRYRVDFDMFGYSINPFLMEV